MNDPMVEIGLLHAKMASMQAEWRRLALAMAWCQNVGARVDFMSVHGTPRVSVRAAGGFPIAERDTFLEAVEHCMLAEERAARR
jgi:hypothetical protein